MISFRPRGPAVGALVALLWGASGAGAQTLAPASETKLGTEAKPVAETMTAAGGKPAAADPEVVTLEAVKITEQRESTSAKFLDRAGTDTLSEILSGAALAKPAAQSSSDLFKDTSGVTVGRGSDGASKISVRGIDTRFLRVTVDGQRQGGTGNALDNIPPEVVQSLEVTKAFTPDMDSDAVGGVINVSTGGTVIKKPYAQGRHQLTYNTLGPRPGVRNSFTLARAFTAGRQAKPAGASGSGEGPVPNASLMITASYDDQYRTRENLRAEREWPAMVSPGPAPYVGVAVPVLTKPHLEDTLEHRKRAGVVLNADARFGDTAIYWRSNLSRDRASRDRKFDDIDPSAGTPVTLTPDYGVFSGVPLTRRDLTQTTQRDAANLSLGGKTHLARADIDGVVGYTYTDEKEPRTLESVFRSDHLFRATYDLRPDRARPQFAFADETTPGNLTSAEDPAHYRAGTLGVLSGDTRDGEASAKGNVKVAVGRSGGPDYVKFGAKVQRRQRDADTDRQNYDAGTQPRDMTGLVGTPLVSWHTAPYRYGPTPNSEAVARLLTTSPGVFQLNADDTAINSRSADYHVTESVWALYGMGKVAMGKWTLIGGARVEGTSTEAEGTQVQFDAGGRVAGFAPTQADRSYTKLMPGVHLRYDPEAATVFRASVTRTLARPGYADLVPYRSLSFSDRRSRSGNPGLQAYVATNFDLSVDKFTEKAGLFSAALFYKNIDHFISDTIYHVDLGPLGGFTEYKRINGDVARAMGAEGNWQSPTWTLPHALGQGSLIANASYLHGEAHYPTRPGETFPLPEQVNYQGSLTGHYERGRLSVETTVRYRSKWWEDLIAPGFDNYLAGYWDAELSVACKVGKDAKFTAGLTNLLDQPQKKYAGITARPNDYLQTGIDVSVGFQWKR